MNDEEIVFRKRLLELYKRSYSQSRFIFTDFLTLYELSLFYSVRDENRIFDYSIFGQELGLERCMIRFGSVNDFGYEENFPIRCIKISPILKKFADDLSHRDFLGALMNLGVAREKIGDIIVKENAGYVFLADSISSYIVENLNFVKHTHIKCEICDTIPEDASPRFEEKQVIVASNRVDSIIAKVYNLSREKAFVLFQENKVFVNGQKYQSNGKSLKSGDVISVRGFGKFKFNGECGTTQKQKLYVSVLMYI